VKLLDSIDDTRWIADGMVRRELEFDALEGKGECDQDVE
jgi:hypothetical protein